MFIMIAMLGFRKTYRPLFSTKIDINRRVWRKHNLMLAIGSAALSGVNAIASTKLPIEEWVIVKISLLPIFFIMILAVSFKSSRQ
jgi:intracellular septation protein A